MTRPPNWQAIVEALRERGLLVRGEPCEGGMGWVVRVHDVVARIDRGVKLLLKPGGDFAERFAREVEIGLHLPTHENLMAVIGRNQLVSRALEHPIEYLVMEWLEGEDLRAYRAACGGTVPIDDVRVILAQCAEGLAWLHDHGVVHRDATPGNIRLVRGHVRRRGWAKLTDFGIAKRLMTTQVDDRTGVPAPPFATQVGGRVGTPSYMAPEQLAFDDATPASDLFTLALVGWELITGTLPLSVAARSAMGAGQAAPGLPALPPNVPAPMASALGRALAAVPGDRGTLSDLVAALMPAAADPPSPARPAASPGTPSGASPSGASPAGASPLGASLLGAFPLGALPLDARPLGAKPSGAKPLDLPPVPLRWYVVVLAALAGSALLAAAALFVARPPGAHDGTMPATPTTCYGVAPVRFDDGRWNATRLVERQYADYARRAAARLVSALDDAGGSAACDYRVVGRVVARAPADGEPVVTVTVEHREQGRWAEVQRAALPDDASRRAGARIDEMRSVDSTAQYLDRLGALSLAVGDSHAGRPCDPTGLGPDWYYETALRDALRHLAAQESPTERVAIVRRVVSEPSQNRFVVELTYLHSPAGRPVADLTPACRS